MLASKFALLKKSFVRQVLHAILYYIVGIFVTWLVYIFSGTPYAHGPNPFHLVALLVITGGAILAIKAIASLFTVDKQVGTLLVHTIVLVGLTISFAIPIRSETALSESTDLESPTTIYRDSVKTAPSIPERAGDTVILKKADQ